MGCSHTFLVFICITHFFVVNGKQIPPTTRPKNQDRPAPYPPPSAPKPKAKPSPKRATTSFESSRVISAYQGIQALKLKVTYDPMGVTKTWNGGHICRDYAGFICSIVPGYNQIGVSAIDFNNFSLGGENLTITDFLTAFPDIVSFHANSNNFTGSIPTDIGKLKYLNDLDLSNNKFSGNFPYQLLRANKLRALDLRFNTFAGIIPPGVFLLNLDDRLFINNNNFIQKLPDNLGSTTVHYLNLANNKFIGGIPPSIGQANNTLFEVVFLNNQLSGCLPYEIGLLNKAYLFDVGSNNLTGPIPHSFQCLKEMETLNMANNMFYGMVPEEMCSLPERQNFTLSYNYFTKVGPQCQQLINNGVLDVKMNCILDFPNQKSSADCAKFFSKSHSCPNEKSLAYVPCNEALLESESIKLTAPETVAMEGPTRASYRALFQDRAVYD